MQQNEIYLHKSNLGGRLPERLTNWKKDEMWDVRNYLKYAIRDLIQSLNWKNDLKPKA